MSKQKNVKEKSISIIDFIKNISINKIPWASYSENDIKLFSPFMLSKWVSMNYNTIEFVNEIQKYLVILDKHLFYNLYLYTFPKSNINIQYIKSKSEKKYNKELISLISMYYQISNSEAEDYINIFFKTESSLDELVTIIRKYGKTDKEIKKLLT